MSATAGALDVVRCPACRGTFATPRSLCPRCGQRPLVPGHLPPEGVVIAATELSIPPAGFPAPHPLLLVELAEGTRVLATSSVPTPDVGATVRVHRAGAGFRVERGGR
jgi:uncharacterized OB-fold protein